jgi:hypothetical protein
MNQQEQRIWELLARKFSGESTNEESQELANLAQHDPTLDRMIKALELIWNDPPKEITPPDPVKMWNRLQEKIELTSQPNAPESPAAYLLTASRF